MTGNSQLATRIAITVRERSMFCGYDVSDSAMTQVTAGAINNEPNMRDINVTSVRLPMVRHSISRELSSRRDTTSATHASTSVSASMTPTIVQSVMPFHADAAR